MTDLRRNQLVGRLAPSPTGGLHLGHARTFLAAWLAVRGASGRIILRVEDLDASRIRPGAAEGILDDLRWLGLDWDEGPDIGGPHAPYLQSQRGEFYAEALDRLKSIEAIYPCTCTRSEIARAASAPHAEDEGPSYPGACSSRSASEAEYLAGRPFAWRLRVPEGEVAWNDLLMGSMRLDPSIVGGDFLLARNGLGPGYQLAVVVDDALMGVTQVVRGSDLAPSTPRQLLLHRALGWKPPTFGHVPLVHGPDGRRLAKRDGSIKLARLRDDGVDPAFLIGWLAMSLGMADRAEPSRSLDWVGRFDPGRVPTSPWQLTDVVDRGFRT